MGVANLTPEKVGIINGLLKQIVGIDQSFEWTQIQEKNYQRFHQMQEEDLQDEIVRFQRPHHQPLLIVTK